MKHNYANNIWFQLTQGAHLGKNSMMFFSLLFLMFFSSLSVVGQNATITSTASPGPTADSPIPITINFKDAVDVLMPADFTVTNGQPLQNLLRTDVNFEYQGKMDLENFRVNKTINDIIDEIGFDFGKIGDYLRTQLKESVISIDFNANNELLYLTLNNGVFKRDNSGNISLVIDAGNFDTPLDLIINRDNGNIYVADSEQGKVLVFDSSYNKILEIGDGNNGESNNPRGATGLALDSAGNIYVADNFTGNTANQDAIKVYKPNGSFLRKTVLHGTSNIKDPFRIAVDKKNNIYLSDSGGTNGRILIFDNNLNPIDKIQGGEQGTPGSLIVDDYGYLYAVDYENDFNLNDLFNDPLKVLDNYEKLRDTKYSINVFDTNKNYTFVKKFDNSELNLPIDIALNNCGLIHINNLKLSGPGPSGDFLGYPTNIDATFDFSIKKYKRQDTFTAEIVPAAPGPVAVTLKNAVFFKCGPQPIATFSIEYKPEEENEAPIANPDDYSTPFETALIRSASDGVLSNDTDPEDDALTAVLDVDVLNGTLSLNPDGSFSYTPDANFSGDDFFTYHANDGEFDSGIVKVTITVGEKVNEAPVATPDTYSTPFETVLIRSASDGVLSNDTDPEDDALTAVLDVDVLNGTLSLNPDGSFSYTPDANFSGDDFFTYHANDGKLDSGIVKVTITVGEKVNEAPVANPDTYSTPFETALIRSASDGVLSNDTDPEDDALTAVLDVNVLNGILSLNPDGSFSYTPDANFSGDDFFTYHTNDGELNSNIATVTINVIPKSNSAPNSLDDIYSTMQNNTLTVTSSSGVLSNDSDPEGESITAVLLSDVTSGTLTLNPDGSFEYVPNTGSFGNDFFTYSANDGTQNSVPSTASIEVVQVSDNSVTCKESVTLELDESGTATLDAASLFTARPEDLQFSVDQEVFTCEDLGENTVTLSYSNSAVQGTCEVIILVKDVSPPILNVNDISVALNEFGSVSITPEMIDNGTSDNCENLSFSLSQLTFGCKELGENTVIFTATDSSGNFTSTTATVTVTGDCTINPGPDVEYIFIYPNPTPGPFQFATPAGVTIQRVEVFDFRGRMILFKNYSETDLQYSMDLTGVQNAVYVLKLFTSEGMEIKRVIIN